MTETATENTTPQSTDVSFEDALSDENGATNPQPKAEENKEDVLEILSPKAKVVKWEVGKGDYKHEYIQRPLSFLARMQWFALVGEVLDDALSGEHAMSLNSLFSAPAGQGSLSITDFRNADTFVQAIGKLLVYMPDFLVKSYAIWLSVPDYERELFVQIANLPEEEGGLSDRQGIEIIETFIDQNYDALDNFFRKELPRLQRRFQARQEESRQSKR